MTSSGCPSLRGQQSGTPVSPTGSTTASCSDEGRPLTVVAADAERGLALCEDADGARSSVEIALVDGARSGAVLLVHAGTALTVLEPA